MSDTRQTDPDPDAADGSRAVDTGLAGPREPVDDATDRDDDADAATDEDADDGDVAGTDDDEAAGSDDDVESPDEPAPAAASADDEAAAAADAARADGASPAEAAAAAEAAAESDDDDGQLVDADGDADGEQDRSTAGALDTTAKLLPGHAQKVVVPVANPGTAQDLLAVAGALCTQGGDIIVLRVVVGEDSPEDADTEALEEQIEALKEERASRNIEFVTRPAGEVARGILDTVSEERADLLVLGVPPPDEGSSVLGRVALAVIDTAPCDVVVVRPGRTGPGIRDAGRIFVAVDGDEESRAAARTSLVLGDGLGTPVTVATVIDRGRPQLDGYAAIGKTMAELPGREQAETAVLRGADTTTCLLGHTREGDVVVVGQHPPTAARNLMGRDSVTSQVLSRSPHPVLVVARRAIDPSAGGRFRRFLKMIRPSLTASEGETLRWTARRQSAITTDYLALMALSALLASFGLVQDSVAVIIGAMLVAPLLGPLSAVSIGLVTTRTSLWERGLVTLLVGTGIVVALSLLVGGVLQLGGPTDQMLLRGSPTLLDIGIAISSGVVGAFATARKEVPAALAGVAIAAALVPPICTIGLGIALGDAALAGGATLLYVINVAAVIAAGGVTFYWLGLRPVDEQDAATRKALVSAGLALGLVLAVVTATVTLRSAAQDAAIVEQDLRDRLEIDDAEVTTVSLTEGEDGVLVVTAVVRTEEDLSPTDVADAEQQLEEDLDRTVELRLVVERLLTPDG